MNGYIMYLIFHVTSQDKLFKWPCDFMSEKPSRKITTFPYFMSIGLVQVGI